jgi:hypothetical protein
VDSLLATFEVSSTGEKQMSRDLKAIAGLDPTPAPPDPTTIEELTKDVGKDLPKKIGRTDGDSVEALLALADASGPLAPPLPPPGFANKPIVESPLIPPASAASPNLPPATAASGASTGNVLSPGSPVQPVMQHPPVAAAPLPPLPVPLPPPHAAIADPAQPMDASPRAKNQAPPPSAGPAPSSRRDKVDAGPGPATTARRPRAGRTTGRQPPRAPRTGLAMLVLTLFVLVAGGIAIWMWKPTFFTGNKPRKPAASTSESVTPEAPPAPRCKVALVVSEVPANAEILLRMGQSPLDVERMPVGTRLEFVATAEGYAPRRAVVRAESPWDKGPDGKPRVDVPIQLDPTKAKPGQMDPWPAAEPGSQVGGSGSPGTVHVVANVRGAEVWLLAGLGPEARIEQLRCDGDIDVLLAGPPSVRKRLHVGEKDIQAATPDPQGNRVVTVSGK